jgi:hypothetical protein
MKIRLNLVEFQYRRLATIKFSNFKNDSTSKWLIKEILKVQSKMQSHQIKLNVETTNDTILNKMKKILKFKIGFLYRNINSTDKTVL